MPNITLFEYNKEPNCGEPDTCCGYSYVQGDSETVELTDEQFHRFESQYEELNPYESLYPEDLDFELKHLDRVQGFYIST